MSLPGAVKALGLGDIRVDSALNEPLSAQIDIVGATRDELIALTAQVANNEVFQHYGADRPAFLASATFRVGMDSHGRPVLNVRSAAPFTDPVVNFLVDLHWGNGELIREYSLLLDPPGFSSPPAGAPTLAADTAPASAMARAPRSTTDPRAAAMTQEPPARAKPPQAALEPVAAQGTGVGQYRVAARDTLHSIVRHVGARSEADARRMMIAIFRANPQAFAGNINRLHLGAVLRMPSTEDLAAIDGVDASREVRAQMTAWRMVGRPAAPRIELPAAPTRTTPLDAVPAAPAAAATASREPTGSSVDGLPTDGLRGRVRSLEHALDDLNQQLASENAAIHDLKQLTAQTGAAPGAVATPGAAKLAATASTPTAAAAPAPAPAAAPPLAGTAPRPDRDAAPKGAVSVDIMHADNHPTPVTPVLAAVAPAAPQQSPGGGLLGPIAIILAVLLAGFAYGRRRLSARAKAPATPMHAAIPGHAPIAEDPQPKHLLAATPRPIGPAPLAAPAAAARPVGPAPLAAAATPPPVGPFALAAPAAAAATTVEEPPRKIPTDQTTRELAIDAEALEQSYLDVLWIDTLGPDALGRGRQAAAASGTARSGVDDGVGLDTVALDPSEVAAAFENANLITQVMDSSQFAPTVLTGANLDFHLVDPDSTALHTHVQMPGELQQHSVESERRISIVDALKSAVERDPSRRDLRMKLLETYHHAASINRRAFLEAVKKLSRERELLTADDWKQVVKMGQEIAGDDILFADPSPDELADCA